MTALGTTALGWPSPPTLPRPMPMPCQIAPYRRPLSIHPANPPVRQILSIHSTLGAFPVFTCPSALPTLSLHSAASTSLSFSFSFPTPPTTRTPRVPLPFFLFAPVLLAISKKHPFACLLPLFYRPCCWSLPAVFLDTVDNSPPASRLSRPPASSTPPDENTGRACCLLFLRVSFDLSRWHWAPSVFPAFGTLRGIEPCRHSTWTWILDVDLDLDLDLDSDSDLGLDVRWIK